jgi:glutamate-1-semialdehyde 2,1-aminomutase
MVTRLDSRIVEQYVAANPTSAKLCQRAAKVIPGGCTHDMRHLQPFLVYMDHGAGPRKWDVDGHEYIDYVMGHGSLIMGHEHPDVVAAATAQLQKATHYGANHIHEVEWAEWVTKLVPTAEKVRFVSSGTEATLMAIRLCRAFSGKTKILRFEGHFHGWHDTAYVGGTPPWQSPDSPGIPQAVLDTVVIAPANDLGKLDEMLSADKDIACVMLEPSGASFNQVPLADGFVKGLEEVTKKRGVLLFFDEVITGFRWAPGGAQERFGITPDITTMAKILAGGLPGGAVAGRADILDLIDFRDDPNWNRFNKVHHTGTFNANPVCAAAGVACLKLVANPEVQRNADAMCDRLVTGFNDVIKQQGIKGLAWGESSCFHVMLDIDFGEPGPDAKAAALKLGAEALMKGMRGSLEEKLQIAMLLNGVHMPGFEGWLSTKHTPADIDQSIAAFDRSVTMLKEEGELS